MSYKGAESEGGVAMGGAKEEGEEPGHKRHRHREHRKRKKKTPHEEILAFVGREWKDLTVEVRNRCYELSIALCCLYT